MNDKTALWCLVICNLALTTALTVLTLWDPLYIQAWGWLHR